MIANYHTHTFRNRHAVGTEREYIEKAIAVGIKTLGFSEHAPYRFPNGYASWFHLQPDELEGYVETILALKREYAGQISILLGFEAEYYPAVFRGLAGELRDLPVDYMILGQHALNNEFDGAGCHEPTDSAELLAKYADQCVAGLETGLFSCLAHPDLFNFTGADEAYREQMRRVCLCARKLGIPLEINMLGAIKSRCYPSARFFSLAKECGNSFIIGLDAHSPEHIYQPEETPQYRALAGTLKLRALSGLPLIKPDFSAYLAGQGE